MTRVLTGAVVAIGFVAISGTVFTVLSESRFVERALFLLVPPIGIETALGERAAVSGAIRSFLYDRGKLSSEIFSLREQQHMVDVRTILDRIRTGAIFALALSIVGWYLVRDHVRKTIHRTAIVGFAVWIIVLAAALLNFEGVFIHLHQRLFTNDLWLLDPAEHALIRAYPPAFFQWFALFFFITLLVLYMVLFRYTKTTRHGV